MLKKIIASMILKWWLTIFHTLYLPLRKIDSSYTSGLFQITSVHLWTIIDKSPGIFQGLLVIPMLVRQDSKVQLKFSLALRYVPELIIITCMEILYKSSELAVTPKAGLNTLLGTDTLLKLILLCLHSTSSQTLLKAPSNWNTFCWCGDQDWYYMPHYDVVKLETVT